MAADHPPGRIGGLSLLTRLPALVCTIFAKFNMMLPLWVRVAPVSDAKH